FKEGDLIVALNGRGDLDPIRLPDLLTEMAERGEKMELTVQRSGQRVTITALPDDFKGRGTWIESSPNRPGSPVAIPALGIAYNVPPTLAGVDKDSPAAKAGLRAGQTLKQVKVIYHDLENPSKVEKDETLKVGGEDDYQWPMLFWSMQIL